jgi:hypothetical protein
MLPIVATTTVQNDRRVVMELPDIEPGTLVTVLVVPADMTAPLVDANSARRRANGWLIDNVGNLLMGKNPRLLSDGQRSWWQVAVYVTNVYREPFGPVGFVEVDAASGEILSDEQTVEELQINGAHLERHPLASGN